MNDDVVLTMLLEVYYVVLLGSELANKFLRGDLADVPLLGLYLRIGFHSRYFRNYRLHRWRRF